MRLVGSLFLAVGTYGVYVAAHQLRTFLVPPLPFGIGIMLTSFGGGVFVVLGILALSAKRT